MKMGMYSWFNTQEIEVTNKRKLCKLQENKKLNSYGLISDDLEVDFDSWSDHKLYGYWFDDTMATLKELAKCIEGYAEFIFENSFPFRIYFEGGKVYLKSGEEVDWDKCEKQNFDSGL